MVILGGLRAAGASAPALGGARSKGLLRGCRGCNCKMFHCIFELSSKFFHTIFPNFPPRRNTTFFCSELFRLKGEKINKNNRCEQTHTHGHYHQGLQLLPHPSNLKTQLKTWRASHGGEWDTNGDQPAFASLVLVCIFLLRELTSPWLLWPSSGVPRALDGDFPSGNGPF